jgi:hypothetical protein
MSMCNRLVTFLAPPAAICAYLLAVQSSGWCAPGKEPTGSTSPQAHRVAPATDASENAGPWYLRQPEHAPSPLWVFGSVVIIAMGYAAVQLGAASSLRRLRTRPLTPEKGAQHPQGPRAQRRASRRKRTSDG